MEKSLHRFVSKYARRETVILCLLTIFSLPFYYLSLDVPKDIFNKAILSRNIKFPVDILGIGFSQVDYLFLLCAWFLALVIINGGIKQYINTLKGRLGERLLRRLRYDLVSRVMRFPLPHFRKVSAGELIPMVTAEVEPLGGYMGDAFAQPLIQAGTLLTVVTFLFVQNPIMGLAAISLYPVQAYIIPKMQRRVNMLGKERVRAMRKVSERIGEAVAGVHEIHAHGTASLERADFSDRLGLVFRIRFEIYQRKSMVKFLNNFLNSMAPLLFYSIGGYLVIQGELTAGALAAALTAHKDMSGPWKELLDYYQQTQDSKIKYDQVTEQFRPENMFEEALQAPLEATPPRLQGPIVAANLSFAEDGQNKALEAATFTIAAGESVALLGASGGGKEAVAMLLARLYLPTGGKLSVAGHDAATLPAGVVGARIGYVGQTAYLFSASVRDNLTYGLRQRPVTPRVRAPAAEHSRRRWLAESQRAGNLALDIEADWVDYAAAGVEGADALTKRAIEVLASIDMEEDIFQLGLRGTIDPRARPEIAAAILKARAGLKARIADPALQALVEPFDPERYNSNATLAENLLFGTPLGPRFETDRLARDPDALAVLDKFGLTADLLDAGRQVAATMIELFAGLPPGHEFFEQFSFISADDLPEFQSLLARIPKGAPIADEDRARLMTLPFKLIEARHRLDLLEPLKARVLAARKAFRAELPARAQRAIEFFDSAGYNAAATLQDNILFGKIAYNQAKAASRVGKLIVELLDELELRPAVLEVGLDFQVGVGGARLAPAQRQKLAIARCLLKRPDLIVVNEATAILDAQAQAKVMDGLFQGAAGRTLVWVLNDVTQALRFARVLVFADARLIEHGRPGELNRPGTVYAELLAAA
ncbi:MAG: ABC transporter transmembrane domain-containing protein [Pseudomonadota bacterium]